MNLWIRSQDKKKLVKCNDIVVNGSCIVGYFDKNTEYEDLGTYKTKERALEVLDEIVEIMIYKQMNNDKFELLQKQMNNKYGEEKSIKMYMQSIVYEMPQN